MKTIGLIGGMSWESTAVYYRLINQMTQTRLGGLHSARLVLWSVDFAEIEALQRIGDWALAETRMVDAALKLQSAGADCIMLCTNTMHKTADALTKAITIPFLHIADATAAQIQAAGCTRPFLLATRYTMEEDFYIERLRLRHGLDVRTPPEPGRTVVHRIIYEELCRGFINPASRDAYLEVIRSGLETGADSVIFGCTEIALLLSPDHLEVPCFDTTYIHARAAVDFALP